MKLILNIFLSSIQCGTVTYFASLQDDCLFIRKASILSELEAGKSISLNKSYENIMIAIKRFGYVIDDHLKTLDEYYQSHALKIATECNYTIDITPEGIIII